MRSNMDMEKMESSDLAVEVVDTTKPAPATDLDEPDGELSTIGAPVLTEIDKKELGVGVVAVAGSSVDGPPTEDSLLSTNSATSNERALASSNKALRSDGSFLLLSQVALSAPASGNVAVQDGLMDDAVDLYRSLKPQDPIESMVGRLMVGLTNSSMDCIARAAQIKDSKESSGARDLNLKFGIKAAQAV
jgi:hypothetical protein